MNEKKIAGFPEIFHSYNEYKTDFVFIFQRLQLE